MIGRFRRYTRFLCLIGQIVKPSSGGTIDNIGEKEKRLTV